MKEENYMSLKLISLALESKLKPPHKLALIYLIENQGSPYFQKTSKISYPDLANKMNIPVTSCMDIISHLGGLMFVTVFAEYGMPDDSDFVEIEYKITEKDLLNAHKFHEDRENGH